MAQDRKFCVLGSMVLFFSLYLVRRSSTITTSPRVLSISSTHMVSLLLLFFSWSSSLAQFSTASQSPTQ